MRESGKKPAQGYRTREQKREIAQKAINLRRENGWGSVKLAAHLGVGDERTLRRYITEAGLWPAWLIAKNSSAPKVQDWPLKKFRERILGRKTFKHMEDWLRWMEDPAATHVLIITCPGAAKTQFIKDYILWRICMDPNIRIGYASASWAMARNHVDSLRKVFEDNLAIQQHFGDFKPEGDRPWAADRFMVRQRSFDTGHDQTDCTLTAYGADSQVASARLDLFVVDDIDGKDNFTPKERADIYNTVTGVFEERLEPGAGRMVSICNRWETEDVAGKIIVQSQEFPGSWKVYSSPAIIRERGLRDWGEVIFPERFGAENGKVGTPFTKRRAWEFFEDRRIRLGPRRFALRYMNDPHSDELREFTQPDLDKALDRGRDFEWGYVPKDALVICSQDPAGDTGGAATLALAILPTGEHLVVDVQWGKNLGHPGLINWIEEFGKYRPKWWAIESQGGFSLYTKDKSVTDLIWRQRAQLERLITNQNKNAEGVGVTSMVGLVRDRLIIPSKRPEDRERMTPLVEQLKAYKRPTWDGERWIKPSGAFDCVMALWFAERVIRDRSLEAMTGPQTPQTQAWVSPYTDSWSRGSWALTR